MATEAVKRPVLLLASPATALRGSVDLLASGVVSVKAVATVKEALTSIPMMRPAVLVIESGAAQSAHIVAARQLAELSASRKVPIVIVGGPLDEATESKRQSLGIAAVIDGAWNGAAVIEAIKPIIEEMDRQLREKQAAEDARMGAARKQNQIRERLAQAAQKLRPPPSYDVEPVGRERKPFDAQALPPEE